jgi:hypothetical protein
MTTPGLETIFQYIAVLISEREAGKPLLLSQLQPAITYKFPNFTFAAYGLSGLREFLAVGEGAGYFKLVNTGNPQTAYLDVGVKRRDKRATIEIADNDPRRHQWMSELVSVLLNAERADQIMTAIRGLEATSPAFDAYLESEKAQTPLYFVKGKISRLQAFLRMVAKEGETAAVTAWQPSRSVLTTPAVPPVKDAPRASAIITTLMKGDGQISRVPVENINNMFIAVIRFQKRVLSKERAWDWVAGLDILEAQARAIPRPDATQQKRAVLLGKPNAAAVGPLDDAEIDALTKLLLREAGLRATMDDTPRWRSYAETPNLDAALRYLAEHPDLVRNDALLSWLDSEISRAVSVGDNSLIRNLASKSAILLTARAHGPDGARGKVEELRATMDSIMAAAQKLGIMFTFIGPESNEGALAVLRAYPDMLTDDTYEAFLEEELIKAARAGDTGRYRRISNRADLLRKASELGIEHGAAQHARYLAQPRPDRTVLTEMGLLLLPMATTLEEKRNILERFPTLASPEGRQMAMQMLDVLSFSGDQDQYNRYFEAKRLIERCLEIGIDRALSEMK